MGNAVANFRPDVLHSFSRILYMLSLARDELPKIMCFQREPTPRTVFLGATLYRSLIYAGISNYICLQGKRGGGEWHTVYNFTDTKFYKFQPNVAPDAPLVFLSRVERIKGAHTAIKVARRTGRRLIIAGNHASSGPEFDYWTQEIASQLGGLIEYVGPVDDAQKKGLLGQAAAMIVPIEWNEPFGIVFAEVTGVRHTGNLLSTRCIAGNRAPGLDGFLVNSVGEACEAVANLNKISRAVFASVSRSIFLFQLSLTNTSSSTGSASRGSKDESKADGHSCWAFSAEQLGIGTSLTSVGAAPFGIRLGAGYCHNGLEIL